MENFQDKVKDLLGPSFNFQIDTSHGGKPKHVDLTTVLKEIDGAVKLEVDFNGNIFGGFIQIGNEKFDL